MEVLLAVGASLVLQVAVALPDLPRVGGEPRVLGAGLEEELVLGFNFGESEIGE